MATNDEDGESQSSFFHPSFEVLEDPSERADHEKHHKWGMDYSFYKPLVVTPEILDSRLQLERLHESCNKACALYCIPNIPYTGPLTSNSRNNIFNAVYNAWYVPNECSIFYGAFATQLIGCWEENSPKDIRSILKSHMELCKQVEIRKQVHDVDKLESAPHVDYYEKFKLTSSYRAVVIIIDKEDWERDGVLFVRTTDEEDPQRWPSWNQAHGEGIRMMLWDAVAAVLTMQSDVETSDERALRLAPGVEFRRDKCANSPDAFA